MAGIEGQRNRLGEVIPPAPEEEGPCRKADWSGGKACPTNITGSV